MDSDTSHAIHSINKDEHGTSVDDPPSPNDVIPTIKSQTTTHATTTNLDRINQKQSLLKSNKIQKNPQKRTITFATLPTPYKSTQSIITPIVNTKQYNIKERPVSMHEISNNNSNTNIYKNKFKSLSPDNINKTTRFRLPPTPLTSPRYTEDLGTTISFRKGQNARSVDGKKQVEPASTPSPTPVSPAKMSVSDRKRLFENAVEEHLKPSPKPEKVFSFLSQDEVEKMKQEEERKIATLTRDELKSWAQIDEMEGIDESEDIMEEQDNKRPNSRLSSRSSISLAQLQGIPSIVRTAKAERRLKERMIQEGLISDDDEESHLSPAEQRALKAEKRAAWRQARLKSLEQDALQAQMVIKKMSEMMDTSNKTDGISTTVDPEPTKESGKMGEFATLRPSSADFPKLAVRSKVGPPKAVRESEKIVDEKVTRRTEEYVDESTGERRVRTVEYVEKLIEREVETLREKIISLELSNAEEDVDNGKIEAASDAESESEDIIGQELSSNVAVESPDSLICTSPTSETAPSIEKTNTGTNSTNAAAKKKKRKRSKKGRN
ncbi:hypothetical protein PV326_010016 [Microctonus aethiopoides]|nr:hypothetical protein PV326_010016 [Microctonus aethiopoides]